MRGRAVAIVVLVVLTVAVPAASASQFVDLGPTSQFMPMAVGDDGTVLSGRLGTTAAARVWRNGFVSDIPTVPNQVWSGASDLNEDGVVVGTCQCPNIRAWHWNLGSTDIPTILTGFGTRPTEASSINAGGDI